MASTRTSDLDYTEQPNNNDLSHLPGDKGLLSWGPGFNMINNLHGMVRDRQQLYGDISRMQVLWYGSVMVLGADNHQEVFLDKERNFSTKIGYEQTIGHLFKGGLLLHDFDDHKAQRRIMQSVFKTPAMRQYSTLINPVIKDNLDQWAQQKNFNFTPVIKEALLQIGARAFIGVKEFDQESAKLNKAFTGINEGLLGIIRFNLPGTRYSRGMKGLRYIHQYFRDIIPQRRTGDGTDMLSHMSKESLDDGNYFSDEEIIQHATFLLFAAHDTTTSVLNHLVMYSALQPEWQEKLRAQSLALGKTELDYDDLDKLPLLDQCFHECLRLHPPAPVTVRRTIRDCELGGYPIPAHTMLFLPMMANQRDEKYWTNPDQFDPDRWSPQRQENNNHPFCYNPFGGGAHKCIGLHFATLMAKCFMHQFLLRYDYTTPAGFKPKLQWIPLPKPVKLPLLLTPR